MASYDVTTFGPVVAGRGAVSMLGTTLRVFVYAVDGLLVDTGPPRLAAAYRSFVGALNTPPRQVVLTHLHEDHCGAVTFARERGLPVYCHPAYVERMAKRPRLPAYRRSFWGVPEPFVARPLGEVVETDRFRFRVVGTPGHAPEHVVLHEEGEGWLFAGDLFIAPRVLTITRDEVVPELMNSLRRALTLDFQTLFCAHAGVVEEGRRALRGRLQALEDIEGEVLRLAAKGWSPRRVTRRLFPRFQPLTLLSLGEYSPAHVVRSLWPKGK